eukprot:scaffold2013_cov139-Amphora_coffeaeformis.AAC.1
MALWDHEVESKYTTELGWGRGPYRRVYPKVKEGRFVALLVVLGWQEWRRLYQILHGPNGPQRVLIRFVEHRGTIYCGYFSTLDERFDQVGQNTTQRSLERRQVVGCGDLARHGLDPPRHVLDQTLFVLGNETYRRLGASIGMQQGYLPSP